jgi:hypothetical protein
MKTMLFAGLLAIGSIRVSFAQQATALPYSLPIDGTSGYVTYRGRIEAPNQSQAQALTQAIRYARTSLTDKPSFTIDSSKVGQAVVSGAGARVFRWHAGTVGAVGRILHYQLTLRPHAGYYEYELTDLTNEGPSVQYQTTSGLATTAAQRGPVEAVLRNPEGFDKKGSPKASLRSYCESVNKAVTTVLSEAKAALGGQ